MFPHQSGAYLFKQLAAADISVNGLSMLSDFNVFYRAVLSFQLFSYLTDNTRNLLDLPGYITTADMICLSRNLMSILFLQNVRILS